MTLILAALLGLIFAHQLIRSRETFKKLLEGKDLPTKFYEPAISSFKHQTIYVLIIFSVFAIVAFISPSVFRQPIDMRVIGAIGILFLIVYFVKAEIENKVLAQVPGLEKIVRGHKMIRYIIPFLILYLYWQIFLN